MWILNRPTTWDIDTVNICICVQNGSLLPKCRGGWPPRVHHSPCYYPPHCVLPAVDPYHGPAPSMALPQSYRRCWILCILLATLSGVILSMAIIKYRLTKLNTSVINPWFSVEYIYIASLELIKTTIYACNLTRCITHILTSQSESIWYIMVWYVSLRASLNFLFLDWKEPKKKISILGNDVV